MSTSEPIVTELRALAAQRGGILRPLDVVEAAKSKNSPLHDRFDWDDTVAAEKWRIEQARQLIKATVMVFEGQQEPMRVFVSLTTERGLEGGYRELVAVLNAPTLREQMLQDALSEMQSFETKYAHLNELSTIFVAAKKVRNRMTGRLKKAA